MEAEEREGEKEVEEDFGRETTLDTRGNKGHCRKKAEFELLDARYKCYQYYSKYCSE